MKVLLLSFIFGLGSTLSLNKCPTGLKRDIFLQTFGDSCFKFYVTKRIDYNDAKKVCHNDGGVLAMPKTKGINEFLARQLRETYSVEVDTWIGLNDEVDEGAFLWEDGSKMEWKNFAPGNGPRSGFFMPEWEDCVTVRPKDGLWHDYHCVSEFFEFFPQKKPFVCQFKAKVDSKKPSTTAATAACAIVECELNCGMLGFKIDEKGCTICKCDDA